MVLHDYHCMKCGETFEEAVDPEQAFMPCPVCSGPARRVFIKAPGVDTPGQPFYCVQSGRRFEDKHQYRDYLKSKGKELMGPDEFRRNQNTYHEPNSEAEMKPRVIEAMKRAYDDCVAGRGEGPPPVVDVGTPMNLQSTTGGTNGGSD